MSYPGKNAERDERIFYYRQLGMPLGAIGARFALSPERVRQILLKRARWADSYVQHEAAARRGSLLSLHRICYTQEALACFG